MIILQGFHNMYAIKNMLTWPQRQVPSQGAALPGMMNVGYITAVIKLTGACSSSPRPSSQGHSPQTPGAFVLKPQPDNLSWKGHNSYIINCPGHLIPQGLYHRMHKSGVSQPDEIRSCCWYTSKMFFVNLTQLPGIDPSVCPAL